VIEPAVDRTLEIVQVDEPDSGLSIEGSEQ